MCILRIYIYMYAPPLKGPPFVLCVVNKTDEEFKQSGASIYIYIYI